MHRSAAALLFVLALALVSSASAAAQTASLPRESLDGYAEWWRGGLLIVDGQRVRLREGGKFKGYGALKTFARTPLGDEVKVKGRRAPDGVLVADEVEAKANGSALFEGDLRSAFDGMEKQYLAERRMYEEGENGKKQVIGRLDSTGPEVERVRRIFERLRPDYLEVRDFRVYVVDNKEWNAMAAPNDSIYVFSGLLRDMDDDEVAIILGHELAHATHEHSRKSFKKNMLIQLAALGVAAITEESVEDKNKKVVLQVAAMLGATAWTNGYGRSHEDQADRVGLRYAAEGGYDVRKGPSLWNRFAAKYGDSSKVVNFFFGDHSVAEARARNLNREIRLNYTR
jgi:Zn-dependent protease with chaperone function